MIVCLAGMGRSGTSLMASYFRHCGIPMGSRLLGGRFNNPRGHFEDQDFLEFHKALLVENKSDMYAPKKNMVVSDEMRGAAKRIVEERRALGNTWGWKEPRTSLFLKLWADLLPEAKFVFMYRDAYANMESLYRIIHKHYVYLTPWVVPKAWLRYNEECYAFYMANQHRCAFVSVEGFNASHERATQLLGGWLDFELKLPYTDVYHAQDMGCGKQASKPFPINLYLTAAQYLYGTAVDELTQKMDKVALVPRLGV